MSQYEDEARAEYPRDKAPGAVDMLRDATDRLHHQIELLTQRLGPILRSIPTEGEKVRDLPNSALEEQVAMVRGAVDRIIELQDRLVV